MSQPSDRHAFSAFVIVVSIVLCSCLALGLGLRTVLQEVRTALHEVRDLKENFTVIPNPEGWDDGKPTGSIKETDK